MEQAQLQHKETNIAALAAIGPRKRRPLDATGNVVQHAHANELYTMTLNSRVPMLASLAKLISRDGRWDELDEAILMMAPLSLSHILPRWLCVPQVSVLARGGPRQVRRVTMRDLVLCMEEDRRMRHSLTLYKALMR